MIKKRSAPSLGRLLLGALLALAVASPCHAINENLDSNDFMGVMLSPKMDMRHLPSGQGASKMLFGSAATDIDTTSGQSSPILNGTLSCPQLNDLAERDVYLLIDHTSSMLREDCPGGVTRWDWLRQQVLNLSENLEKQIKGHISLVPFAGDFKIYPQVRSPQVKSILKGLVPSGSTHPEKALQSVFNSYFAARDTDPEHVRPLMVVVVTDGVPNEPDEVIDVVTNATARLKDSREILVTFLQIANDQQGNSIMEELDSDLVRKNGARFDIINRKDFREVQTRGLESCLIEAFATNVEEKLQLLATALEQ
jgi:hypothetical protein